ncbi:GNAT family N-acetyltransferase [uncultured Kordia sp.]|uniref:GNAT family N-acetyltransferase n=1 Tax=uncultured Kordia sp. TaxID=507699 RepID=UPI00260C23C2|nr:GNAT family N-acetyltransferase [uncultured Kordia sp.]
MIHIRKATPNDINAIAQLGSTTFLDTYLPNTPKEAVESFVENAFAIDTLCAEFDDPNVHYFLIFLEETLAGYSKIIHNVPNTTIEETQLTKLDRFYVLKEFHGQKLGAQLFNHTIDFSKENEQQGIWLYVLIENERALRFYQQNNFQIVGEYDFKISETRYNPNYIMYLEY